MTADTGLTVRPELLKPSLPVARPLIPKSFPGDNDTLPAVRAKKDLEPSISSMKPTFSPPLKPIQPLKAKEPLSERGRTAGMPLSSSSSQTALTSSSRRRRSHSSDHVSSMTRATNHAARQRAAALEWQREDGVPLGTSLDTGSSLSSSGSGSKNNSSNNSSNSYMGGNANLPGSAKRSTAYVAAPRALRAAQRKSARNHTIDEDDNEDGQDLREGESDALLENPEMFKRKRFSSA